MEAAFNIFAVCVLVKFRTALPSGIFGKYMFLRRELDGDHGYTLELVTTKRAC